MRRLFVLKIGGAVLTHKNGYCEPNVDAVNRFADRVRQVWPAVRGQLIVVIGGGSFGNAIPTRYGLLGPDRLGSKCQTFRMTCGMFHWATLVSEVLAESGIPAYPFQLSALAAASHVDVTIVAWSAIDCALANDMLPILTGDLLLAAPGCDHRILSSDDLPDLLTQHYELTRVVFQSDVEGLYYDRERRDSLARRVSHRAIGDALRCAGPSAAQDITGGMTTKVHAIERLTARGIPVVLCSAEIPSLATAFFSSDPPGTLFEPACPRPQATVNAVGSGPALEPELVSPRVEPPW